MGSYEIGTLTNYVPSDHANGVKLINANELSSICFGPGPGQSLKPDSGWQTSSCRELHIYFMSIFDPMISSLKTNTPDDYLIQPEYLMNHFQNRMLAEVRRKCEDNGSHPIIWKTTPSRRHSNPGYYIILNHDISDMPISRNPPILPPILLIQPESTTEPEDLPNYENIQILDRFFIEHYHLQFVEFNKFTIDLRTLFHHILLWKIFDSQDPTTHNKKVFLSHDLCQRYRYSELFYSNSTMNSFWTNQKKSTN